MSITNYPLCCCGCNSHVKCKKSKFLRGHFFGIHNQMKGKKHSDVTKERMSKSHIGKHHSNEIKEKIRVSSRGKKHKLSEKGLARQIEVHSSEKFRETCRNVHRSRPVEIENLRKEKLRNKRLLQVFPSIDTSIEVLLQKELLKRNIEFHTHVSMEICQPDIFIPSLNTIILADGCYWHGCSKHGAGYNPNEKYDRRAEKYLETKGFFVFRFWEHEIKESPSKCIDLALGDIYNVDSTN